MRIGLLLAICFFTFGGRVYGSCRRSSGPVEFTKKDQINIMKHVLIGKLSDVQSGKLPNGVSYRLNESIENIKGRRTFVRKLLVGKDGQEKLINLQAGIVSKEGFDDEYFPVKHVLLKDLTGAQEQKLRKRITRELAIENGSSIDIRKDTEIRFLDLASKEGQAIYHRIVEVPARIK